jgi:hypothetical protein
MVLKLPKEAWWSYELSLDFRIEKRLLWRIFILLSPSPFLGNLKQRKKVNEHRNKNTSLSKIYPIQKDDQKMDK